MPFIDCRIQPEPMPPSTPAMGMAVMNRAVMRLRRWTGYQ